MSDQEEKVIQEMPVLPCKHVDTEPAERDRWRRCLDCFQVVHRQDTAHYRRVIW